MESRDDVQTRIASLRSQLSEEKAEQEEVDSAQKVLMQEQYELQRRLREIQDSISSNKSILWDKKSAIRKIENQIDSEDRALRRVEIQQKAVEDLRHKGYLLDLITADAKWRQDENGEGAYEHQISGAKQFAVMERGLLGDERGLGKTLTSIAWCDMVRANKVVFAVPKQTATSFHNEIPRWCGNDRPVFSFVSVSKIQRDQTLKFLSKMDRWNIVINLEAWRKDSDLLRKIIELQPEAVVIDEAHYIKSRDTSAFKGVSKLVYTPNFCPPCGNNTFTQVRENYAKKWQCDSCNRTYDYLDDSICSVKYVLPMTGTPILNRPDELYANLYIIDRKSFSTLQDFRDDFLYQNTEGKWKFRSGGQDALIEKLGMRFLVRRRNDVGIKVPPQTIEIVELDFNPEDYPQQWKAYWELEHKHALILEDHKVPVIALAVITRQRQMMTWPAGIELRDPESKELLFRCGVEESIKVDRATELLTEFAGEGLRSVAFSQFRAPLHEINRRLQLKGIRSAVFDGTTPQHLREEIINDLDAHYTPVGDHKYNVVLCGYKVGGQSLNFTGVSETLIIDREWNPGKEDQALGRTDRIGQVNETTRVHILRAVPSIDEWLDKLIEEKAELTDELETASKAHSAVLDYFKKAK